MIKEFALEPDAITSSYRDFCYFTEKFGISHGRVISEFPKKWRRMVCDSAQRTHGGKVEFSRIVEKLKSLKGEVVFESGRPSGDGNKEWIIRALEEHARNPFDAIIAQENLTAHVDILVAADLDETDARFQAAGQRHITRTATEMIGCVRRLLGAARTVKLIDPHFDPTKTRFRRPLELVLNALSGNGQTGVTLEIHCSDKASKISPVYLKSCFDSNIPKIIPAGITVQVFLHPETAMHNRFILTSVGGASYHTGLDDNEDGNSTPTDLVSLLAPGIFAAEWATYSSQTAFLVYP